MLIFEENLHKINWSVILIRGRENHVSPKSWLTHEQTDICFYRVALLLKRMILTAAMSVKIVILGNASVVVVLTIVFSFIGMIYNYRM